MRMLIVMGLILLGMLATGCSSSDDGGTAVSPTAERLRTSPASEPFTPPPPPSAPEGFTLHRGSSGDFQIAYPEDWQVLSDLPSSFSAGLKADDGAIKALVQVAAIARPEGERALAQLLEAQSAYLTGRPGYLAHGTEKITVFGKQAQIADYEMLTGDSGLWRYLTLRMAAGDHLWTVTCSCPVETFGLHQARFYQIIGSFHLFGEVLPEPLTPSPEPSPVPVPPLIPGG